MNYQCENSLKVSIKNFWRKGLLIVILSHRLLSENGHHVLWSFELSLIHRTRMCASMFETFEKYKVRTWVKHSAVAPRLNKRVF